MDVEVTACFELGRRPAVAAACDGGHLLSATGDGRVLLHYLPEPGLEPLVLAHLRGGVTALAVGPAALGAAASSSPAAQLPRVFCAAAAAAAPPPPPPPPPPPMRPSLPLPQPSSTRAPHLT